MDYLLNCHKCGEVIVKDTGSEAKIRGRVILVKGENTSSVCPRCNTEVAIPLKLDTDMMKSLRSRHRDLRLFINKNNK